MKSIPKRHHSMTRLERRSNGLSIFYKRGNEDMEEEMMRVSVIKDEVKYHEDTLRSSKSSKSLKSESMVTVDPSSTSSLSDISGKKKRKKKKKTKERKKKTSKTSKRYRSKRHSYLWNLKRKRLAGDSMDEDTIRVLHDLKTLNSKIRMRFQIGESPSYGKSMGKLNRDKKKLLSSFSSRSSSSNPSTKASPKIETAKTISRKTSRSSSPVLTAEVFDYRGRPMTKRLPLTPYPGARSDKNPSKSAQKTDSTTSSSSISSFIKPPIPPVSSSSTSSRKKKSPKSEDSDSISLKLRRVNLDTKYPGASSPATRERVRMLLKDFALKKQRKKLETDEFNLREDANLANALRNIMEEKKNKKEKSQKDLKKTKKTEITSTSLRTIYSKSNMTIGCDSCSSCVGCISTCVKKHTEKKSQKSSKKIKKSRKKKPGKSKSKTTITSSVSESIVISNKSRKKKKKKKEKMKTETF